VLRFLVAPSDDRYELAFVDPPYAERDILAPLEHLVPHLAPGAAVVVKHFWRSVPPPVRGLATWRERRFGETGLTFLEAVEES
jgi:16S rRNA G966 N2-methylase RsmD